MDLSIFGSLGGAVPNELKVLKKNCSVNEWNSVYSGVGLRTPRRGVPPTDPSPYKIMYLFLIFQWLTDLICRLFTKFDIRFGFANLELSLATRTETVHPEPRAVSRGLFKNEVDMASTPVKFDLVASATSAAELMFQAEQANVTLAQFKLRFTQTIAEARRNGVDNWGGMRHPGTYGDVYIRTLRKCLWPKDQAGLVLTDDKIGDDTLKPLKKKLERLGLCGKTCFTEELALTHLTANGIRESNICLYTGNVKGAQAKSNEEPESKGAQATKTPKHLGYVLAPFMSHKDVVRYLGSVSAELRKVKVVDGTALQKALIDVALKEKLLQGKDGEIKTAK